MKFKDFERTDDNHFIAMQYYKWVLNRTFLVLLTKESLIGIKVNGQVSVDVGRDPLQKALLASTFIKGDLNDPNSYLKPKYMAKLNNTELLEESILAQNKSNFIIKRADISNAYHDPKKKWGMGYYPHDGKVYIETYDGQKKEFIILGNQSGQKIANLVLIK